MYFITIAFFSTVLVYLYSTTYSCGLNGDDYIRRNSPPIKTINFCSSCWGNLLHVVFYRPILMLILDRLAGRTPYKRSGSSLLRISYFDVHRIKSWAGPARHSWFTRQVLGRYRDWKLCLSPFRAESSGIAGQTFTRPCRHVKLHYDEEIWNTNALRLICSYWWNTRRSNRFVRSKHLH